MRFTFTFRGGPAQEAQGASVDLFGRMYRSFRALSAGVLVGLASAVNFSSDFELSLTDGVLTVALSEAGVGSVERITTESITVYVDVEEGDDSWSGELSEPNDDEDPTDGPFATIEAARDRLAMQLRHDCAIRIVRDGVYDLVSFDRHTHAGGQLFIYGEPVTEVIASTAALSGSGAATVKTSGRTVNAHRGEFIEILSGPGAGDRRSIESNDADDFFPARAFSATLTTSSFYRVIRPAVTIRVPASATATKPELHGSTMRDYIARGGHRPTLNFANVTFSWAGASPFAAALVSGEVGFFGCDDDGTMHPATCEEGVLLAGMDSYTSYRAYAPNVAGLAASVTAWAGYGYTSRFATPMRTNIAGWPVAAGVIVAHGTMHMLGGNLYGGAGGEPAVDASFAAKVHITGAGNSCLPRLSSQAETGTVYAHDCGTVQIARGVFTNTHATGDALRSETGGLIGQNHSTLTSGSANGYGSHACLGGRIALSAGSDGQEITGGIANLAAGDGATLVTAPSLAAAGDFIVSDDGTGRSDGSVVQRTA